MLTYRITDNGAPKISMQFKKFLYMNFKSESGVQQMHAKLYGLCYVKEQ
jgi:hypothetical protein